jgi:alpha-beta hydrolase superfamily lysophospholipase
MAKDPLCYKAFQNEGLMTVMEADFELKKIHKYQCKNPELKILSVSGKDDPVTGGTKGLADTVKTLKKIGYRDIKVIEYPGMMHEILNEEDPSPVYRDILDFLEN